jgi:hypothetical protein
MIYYANPSTEAIRDEMARGTLGCIITPHQRNTVFADEWDVMADNGCFSDRWNHHSWFRWMTSIPRTVRFVVAPDVYDPDGRPTHSETIERWRTYGPLIERHGHVPAFVCQVGAERRNVPTDAPVLFLGGTTEWKLGADAASIAADAKSRDVWVHMGRVNSKKRFDIARSMLCDSVDGTFLTFGPDANLPKLRSWIRASESEPMLWEVDR